MTEQKDILGLGDIKELVDAFYEKVRQDTLLADIFNRVIQDRWPQHREKMYRFWQTVLLEEHTYFGNPFPPHARLPIDSEHFDRWKALFFETINERFYGAKADEAKWRAEKMAEIFQAKRNYYQQKEAKPLL